MNNIEARELIAVLSKSYKKRKKENNLYTSDDMIPIRIIELYEQSVVKPKFKNIVDSYKKKYIYNEARVEKNITRAEQQGLGEIYDYISNFDYEKNNFNIFICAMVIHQKLYSKCPNPSFGGTLRDDTAILVDSIVEVPPADVAKKYFNSFIPNSNFIFEPLEQGDMIGYIDTCVITITKLIKYQPFIDGNKRTFRALLNLMLKKINLPPIYIEVEEREEYKKALIAAMRDDDYKPMVRFYHYKICDAIVELDVNNSEIQIEEDIEFKNRISTQY